MRDAIMIAYLGATAALFGVALGKGPIPVIEHPGLLLVVPFLALGACSIVTLHQDQSTAYYQYFAIELRECMAPDDQRVTSFYMSRTAGEHTIHILRTLFISQLLLLCGPAVVAVMMNSVLLGRSRGSTALFITSAGVTILSGWRAWSSMKYRNRVMERLFHKNTGSPSGDRLGDQPAPRESQAGPYGVAERLVGLMKPGNAGGGKGLS
jgi:hypothetical protein